MLRRCSTSDTWTFTLCQPDIARGCVYLTTEKSWSLRWTGRTGSKWNGDDGRSKPNVRTRNEAHRGAIKLLGVTDFNDKDICWWRRASLSRPTGDPIQGFAVFEIFEFETLSLTSLVRAKSGPVTTASVSSLRTIGLFS